MAAGRYEYEGMDYLHLGETGLRNYNASVADMVVRYAGGARDVVDFGAGIGSLALLVRARGIEPLCVEPDLRQHGDLERRGFRYVNAVSELPDESADYVYSSNVLEHIEDDVQALRELRRVLRPGGRVFLYVPAFQSLFSDLDATVGHLRRYDRAMLGERLRAAGLAVEDTYYADVFGYFATALFKRLGNSMSNANSVTLTAYDRVVFPVGRLIERFVRLPVGKNVVGVARKT